MRLLIINHVENAWQSLRSTRLRTALTMLGVTIGIGSITAVLSLSGGATQLVQQQVEQLDGNIALVRPGGPSDQNNFSLTNTQINYSTSTLTGQDVEKISKLPNVAAAAPLMTIRTSMKGDNVTIGSEQGTVLATTPAFADITKLKLRNGQFIDSTTNNNTAVIGAQLSIDLFGTGESIGKTFKIRDQSVTVIGIMTRQNNPVNYNAIDLDKTAIISLTMGTTFTQGVTQPQQINIKATDTQHLASVVSDVQKTLLASHNNENDFTILSGEAISKPTSQLFYALTSVSAVIAGISLIIGGVGIMNIMLVNVAERTREIGLRKALGASNGHITWQFLIESLAIAIGGGLGGYIVGYALAFAVSTALPFGPFFSWQILVTALGTSLVIGLLFGLYPALRAARKDPIESLGHYH